MSAANYLDWWVVKEAVEFAKYKFHLYSIHRVLIPAWCRQGIILHDKPVTATAWLATNHTDFTICFACNRPPRHSRHFTYRQVRIVAVTVVNGSDDPRPPWPPSDVSDFWWFVPTDTEKPLPDQLRPSVDCHGPSLVNPPPPLDKTSQIQRLHSPVI